MSIVEIIYWLSVAETFAGLDRSDFAHARELIIRREKLRWWILRRRRGVSNDRHEMKSPNPITRAMVPIERRRTLVLVWLMRQAERALRGERVQ